MILGVNDDHFYIRINQLIFVMTKSGVLFEVRAEYLNII
jgi:hypothetical protein